MKKLKRAGAPRLRALTAVLFSGAAVLLAGATPAQAAGITDVQCLAEATGYLTVPTQITAGDDVTISWATSAPCAVTRHILGPGFNTSQSLTAVGHQGVAVDAAGPARWQLQLVANRTGRSVVMDDNTVQVLSAELADDSFAVQASSGKVQTVTAAGVTTSDGPAIGPGTSPAMVSVLIDNGRSQGRVIAYQATDGFLYTISPSGAVTNTGLGMKAGTSPSIATTATGYLIAFQANTGVLWTLDQAGTATKTGYVMAPGTNPSASLSTTGDAWIAYTGSDRLLREIGPDRRARLVGNGLAVMPRTSPSLSMDGAGKLWIAFQAQTGGTLWVVSPTGAATDTHQKMAAGSSPSLVAWSDEVVFAAADHFLWQQSLYGTAGRVSNGLGVAPATSPSATMGVRNQVNIAFQALGEGTLWTVGLGGPDWLGHDTGLPMAPATSPAAAFIGTILY